MSSSMMPVYQPVSFVSPISDTTRRHSSESSSALRRLSTYLKNSVTLEPAVDARRRESIISDHVSAQQESVRRASITSAKDRENDAALRQWRRESIDGFWSKHGEVDEGGVRRASIVSNDEGEVGRRTSVGARTSGKWRKMSWSGRREE